MKSPITDTSRMTAIRKRSPFLIACRIGNRKCQFGWLGVRCNERICWLQRLNLNRGIDVFLCCARQSLPLLLDHFLLFCAFARVVAGAFRFNLI